MTPAATAPSDAKCPRHPDVPVAGTCRRCGTFICASDLVLLDGSLFCADCAKRPDVDYLEAFRLEYWGKRDSWAWLFGLGGLSNALGGLATVVVSVAGPAPLEEVPEGLSLTALGAMGILFWLGVPFARVGLLAGVGLVAAVQGYRLGGVGAGVMLLPLLVVAAAISSTRNRLFFKLPVSRDQLKRAWDLLRNNSIARSAFLLGLAGLVFPPFPPMAVIAGVIGLRRVDPAAHPPIGRKGQAIAGIVLGALGTLEWIAIVVASLRSTS